MAPSKLGTLADDKPVRLTVELPASPDRDLAAYAEVFARETGQSVVSPQSWWHQCWRGSWQRIARLRNQLYASDQPSGWRSRPQDQAGARLPGALAALDQSHHTISQDEVLRVTGAIRQHLNAMDGVENQLRPIVRTVPKG